MPPPVVIDPPGAAMLMRIESPGFRAAEPDRLHGDRMPAGILAACAAQQQRWFPPRAVRVWVLDDVLVAFEGLVFDRAGRLYAPSVTQHGPAEIAWAAAAVGQAIEGKAVQRHDLPLVLAKKRGAGNYGHWLMEMLPMAHLVLDRLRDARAGVLVHDVTDPQLGEVMQTSLRLLGVADDRVRVSGFDPVRVERLILVEGLTVHGTYMSPLIRPPCDRLSEAVAGIGHDRVFIARAPGLHRNFADPLRVERVVEEQGYFVMRPDRLGLRDQIATLRDARVVAGAMGAAMTSLAFAGAPARILVFAGADMPDTFFWFLANHFGHGYREIRCRQEVEVAEGAAFYDRDLLIDDEELRRRLADA